MSSSSSPLLAHDFGRLSEDLVCCLSVRYLSAPPAFAMSSPTFSAWLNVLSVPKDSSESCDF